MRLEQTINDLESHRQAVRMQMWKYHSEDNNNTVSRSYRDKLTKIKRQLYQLRYKLNRYKAGYKAHQIVVWKSGTYEPMGKTRAYLWLEGLIHDLYHKRMEFAQGDETMVFKTYKGKDLPPAHKAMWDRQRFIYHNLNPYENLFLDVKDGRWLTNYMLVCVRRLKREHAINAYLPKEQNTTLQNDNYRKEAMSSPNRAKFTYYELEEITSMRDMPRLAANPWMQLRDDEREMLTKVTLELHETFKTLFLVQKV